MVDFAPSGGLVPQRSRATEQHISISAVADDEPAVVRVYRQAAGIELPVVHLRRLDYDGVRKWDRPLPWTASIAR